MWQSTITLKTYIYIRNTRLQIHEVVNHTRWNFVTWYFKEEYLKTELCSLLTVTSHSSKVSSVKMVTVKNCCLWLSPWMGWLSYPHSRVMQFIIQTYLLFCWVVTQASHDSCTQMLMCLTRSSTRRTWGIQYLPVHLSQLSLLFVSLDPKETQNNLSGWPHRLSKSQWPV